MHDSSLKNMRWAVESYLRPLTGRALDVGSRHSSPGAADYRPFFKDTGLVYTGCDIVPGENVDLVMPGPYEIPSAWGKFEVIISGQVAEHVADIYCWLRVLRDALKPQGRMVIISPYLWCGIHNHPGDYWRILPDAYTWLLGTLLKMQVLYSGLRESDIIVVGGKK